MKIKVETLAANYKAIKKNYPELLKIIEPQDLDNHIEVRPAKTGIPSLRVRNKDGDWISLHSSYDPVKEGERLAGGVNIKEASLIVIRGLGLGYHLQSLLKRVSPHHLVLAVEENPAVFRAAIASNDLSGCLDSKQVIFAVGSLKDIELTLPGKINPASFGGVEILDHMPSVKQSAAFYQEVLERVKRTINRIVVQMATYSEDADKWLLNVIENIPEIASLPGVGKLYGQFRDIPGIIVAAGPSLDKNIEYLRMAKGKALTICVSTSLKALLARGIEPDLVLSIDPREENYGHFRDQDCPTTLLAAEPTSHPDIFRNYKGPKVIMSFSSPIMKWLEEYVGPIGDVDCGGSVATTAFDLAIRLGLDPITFVGQDLAYTNGLTHASGTNYEGQMKFFNQDGFDAVKIPGYFGGEVLTSRSMYGFLSFFEIAVENNPGRTVINSTEGGASIKGTQCMPLKEFIFRYCKGENEFSSIIQSYLDTHRMANFTDLTDGLKNLVRQYSQIEDITLNGLKAVQRTIKDLNFSYDVAKIQKGLIKINEAQAKLEKLEPAVTFLSNILQPLMLRIACDAQKEENIEKRLEGWTEYFKVINEVGAKSRRGLQKSLALIQQQVSE